MLLTSIALLFRLRPFATIWTPSAPETMPVDVDVPRVVAANRSNGRSAKGASANNGKIGFFGFSESS